MQPRNGKPEKPKKVKYVRDAKARGLFGDANYDTRVIRVNPKMHSAEKKRAKTKTQRKNARVIDTLVHETMHMNHPKMHERTVRKLTKKRVAKMSKTAKKRLYSKLRNK